MKPIKYLIEKQHDLKWGLSICCAGFEEISPGVPYPAPNTHGKGYYFSPQEGRILHEYQLLYISDGKGSLFTRSAGAMELKAGNMFLLFPGEWHTYQPDKQTGWKEYWIGFKGINIDNRVEQGFLNKEHPLFYVGHNEEIIRLYRQAIDIANREEPFFQQMLAGITNYLLGLMYSLDRKYSREKDDDKIVVQINRARIYMRENIDENLSAEQVAEHLQMSYSLFRKQFKEYTGLSPSHYFQEIKLQRAKELLLNTSLTIKEVAYTLNFEPDYFSALFKKKTGLNPGSFREEGIKKKN